MSEDTPAPLPLVQPTPPDVVPFTADFAVPRIGMDPEAAGRAVTTAIVVGMACGVFVSSVMIRLNSIQVKGDAMKERVARFSRAVVQPLVEIASIARSDLPPPGRPSPDVMGHARNVVPEVQYEEPLG